MRWQTIACRLIGAFAALGAVTLAGPGFALQLITKAEAALPSAPVVGQERGITRGPSVVIVSPPPIAGTVTSPLELKLKFEGHGGAQINVNSVVLTYLKVPAVDLTQRLKPYISATGIDVTDAEVPPGTHTLRVNLLDTDGRPNTAEFTFTVSK